MRHAARRTILVIAAAALVTAALVTIAQPGVAAQIQDDRDGDDDLHGPIVIGHRGASGFRPEHTLAAYELAIDMGADYVEPDLVSTKDGVLVARHENEISATTDVADHPEFADRYTTKTIDGVEISGWFTEDFTLAELKTLRARERIPAVRPGNTAYNDLYEIPTLQEVIDLVRDESRDRDERIGLYPETKHPTYFDSIGLSLEEPLVETLHDSGLRRPTARVYIQSFEVGNLQALDEMTRLPLVQLLSDTGAPYDFVVDGDPRTYADMATPEGLEEISTYAEGVGVNKNLIIPRDADGNLTSPTSLVDDAHEADLIVHAWTFRSENAFLPTNLQVGDPADPVYPALHGNWAAEYDAFFATGLDGLFSDQPNLAIAARDGTTP
jgi:glycerophosphoryl diester phosphodiesterase